MGTDASGLLPTLLAGLGRPFERTTAESVASLLETHFGLIARTIGRLDTEKDDTFRIETAGETLLLKIAHPDDDPQELDLQTAAMIHASERDPGLPLQSVMRTTQGDTSVIVDGRIARLLSWVPGELLRTVGATPEQYRQSGRMLARLDLALADFEHPASARWLAWDVQRLGDLTELLEFVVDTERRERLGESLREFVEHTEPTLKTFRRQTIYNDFHGENVVADPAVPGFVTGIFDFGDLTHSYLVLDLAVAMSYAGGYAAEPATDAWAPANAMRDGYLEILPLTDAELELLPSLVRARLAQRVLLGSWLTAVRPENADYLGRNVDLSWREYLALNG